MSKRIYFQGKNSDKYVLVDDDDYDELIKYKWYVNTCGYASKYKRLGKRQIGTLMHRLILGLSPKDGFVVDHINRDILDNRKSNLRICTQSENIKNSYTHGNKEFKSQFKGVFKTKDTHPTWAVRIVNNKKNIFIGTFHDEKIAALAYDQAARKYHGEFACLNFPEIINYDSVHPSKRSPYHSSPYEGIVKRRLKSGKITWMVFYKRKYITAFNDIEEANLFRIKYIKEHTNDK